MLKPLTRRTAVCAALGAIVFASVSARCIENTRMYVDNDGYVHVVGEMYNDTDVSATSVTLRGQLFDGADNVISETTGGLCPVSVQPTTHNVFDLRFPQPNINGVSRFEVRPTAGATVPNGPPDPKLKLPIAEAKRFGATVGVRGDVTNNGSATYTATSACVGFYDVGGKVVRVLSAPIQGTLAPGGSIHIGLTADVPSEAVSVQLWFVPSPAAAWIHFGPVTIQ